MSSGPDGSPKRGDRRLLLAAAGTALALIVLVVVTTARHPSILQRPDRDPDLHVRHGTFQAPTLFPGATARRSPNKAAQQAADTLGTIMLDILLVLLLLGLLWLVIACVVSAIRRWRVRAHVAREGPLPDVDDAVLDAVGRATQRQGALLKEGTPSNAVVACWVDLEQAVAAVGIQRRPSETSAELTIRVLDALDVDSRALRTLGRLYREARYSAHPLTERDRQSAVDALEALRRSLPVVYHREQV